MKGIIIGLLALLMLNSSAFGQVSDLKEVKKLIKRGDELRELNKSKYLKDAILYYDAALIIEPNNIVALYNAKRACDSICSYDIRYSKDISKLYLYYAKSFFYTDRVTQVLKDQGNRGFSLNETKEININPNLATFRELMKQKKREDEELKNYVLNNSNPTNGIEFAFENCRNSQNYEVIKNMYYAWSFNELMNNVEATIDDYDYFLMRFPDFEYNTKIIRKRDSLAYSELLQSEEMNSSMVTEFIVKHPATRNQKYAESTFSSLFDSLVFYRNELEFSVLKKRSYDDCKNYLYYYPSSQYDTTLFRMCATNYFRKMEKEGTSSSYQNYINKYPNNSNSANAERKRNKLLYQSAMKSDPEKMGKLLDELISDLYGNAGWNELYRKAIYSRDSLAVILLSESSANYEDYNRFISTYPNSDFIEEVRRTRNERAIAHVDYTYGDDILKYNKYLLQDVGMPVYVLEGDYDKEAVGLERKRLEVILAMCGKADTETEKVRNYRRFLYLFYDIAPDELISKAEQALMDMGKDPYKLDE